MVLDMDPFASVKVLYLVLQELLGLEGDEISQFLPSAGEKYAFQQNNFVF